MRERRACVKDELARSASISVCILQKFNKTKAMYMYMYLEVHCTCAVVSGHVSGISKHSGSSMPPSRRAAVSKRLSPCHARGPADCCGSEPALILYPMKCHTSAAHCAVSSISKYMYMSTCAIYEYLQQFAQLFTKVVSLCGCTQIDELVT